MAIISRGFVNQTELESEIAEAAKALDAREVRDVRFRLGTDVGGDPSIFFRILLTPAASLESRLAKITARIPETLIDTLQPYDRWGLLPYFSFTDDAGFHGRSEWD